MNDVKCASPVAYELFHRGTLAFSEIEAAGMRIDVTYLDKTITETEQRITSLEGKLKECDEYKLQRRRYGSETNLTSREQLAAVLYDDMKLPCESYTSGGKSKKRRPQLDESALERTGLKYARGFLKMEKLNKLLGTYLRGVRREVEDDGFLHVFNNLHTAHSYRGSNSDINFQNIPVRDPEIGKLIRTAFIPRSDEYVLVESDFSSQEVKVACNLCVDPTLIHDTYEGDMHRDMAAECFMLPVQKVTKAIRSAAKSGFVFAEFYGDWHKQVAQNLWASSIGLTDTDGTRIEDHLSALGITELGECDPNAKAVKGTFEHHIMQVEDRFWNTRFRVYNTWRQERVRQYRSRGWFELVTGFVCAGVFSKNQVMNLHIQGPAFHCMLWTMIQLVAELKKRKMRSRVIGQIHDSIVGDVHKKELDDYAELVTRIATKDIMDEWKWITVPLGVEIEVGEQNWYSKVKYPKTTITYVACGDTGCNSKGGECVPCRANGRIKQ